MKSLPQSIRPHDDLTRKGEAALDLIHRAADTMSEMENRLEAQLLQTLDQLKTAEDRHAILSTRIPGRGAGIGGGEMERRVHDEVEPKLRFADATTRDWCR